MTPRSPQVGRKGAFSLVGRKGSGAHGDRVTKAGLRNVEVFRPPQGMTRPSPPKTPSGWAPYSPPKLSPRDRAFLDETAQAVAGLFD